MKFTDLYFDCLEKLFEYLELPDLLNVADSTKLFKKAAELAYTRKYGNKCLAFGVLEISPDQPFQFTNEKIKSKGLILACSYYANGS